MAALQHRGPSRPYGEVFTDAVRVLTEAVHLTRPVLVAAPPGEAGSVVVEASVSTVGPDGVERDREVQEVHRYVESGRSEPVDFAEFVAQVMADVSADVGGVQAMLAGGSGSEQADAVRQMLLTVLGRDED